MSILDSRKLGRRSFLGFAGQAVPGALALWSFSAGAAVNKKVRIVEFDLSGIRKGVVEIEKIKKPAAEWKSQLTPEQFWVTRQAERPGTGKYANNHADGLYHCICCDTVLFDSKTKFEIRHRLAQLLDPARQRKYHRAAR